MRGRKRLPHGLRSTVASQQPGAQLQRHEHFAGQGVAQHFQAGLPSQHSPGMPGVDNDVWCDDVAGENVWLSRREKHGPEGVNDYTNCTQRDRINECSKHRRGESGGSKWSWVTGWQQTGVDEGNCGKNFQSSVWWRCNSLTLRRYWKTDCPRPAKTTEVAAADEKLALLVRERKSRIAAKKKLQSTKLC